MSECSLTSVVRVTRAAPLPPDERRRALIAATRPLLLEYGLDVTTRQIAQAAGVAEGTIFRAFDTKADLFEAVLCDALSPDATVAALRDIPPELNLEDTITWILKVMQSAVSQIRALFVAVAEGGPKPRPGHGFHSDRDAQLTAALVEIFDRFDDDLRVSPLTAAWAVKALAFGLAHPLTADPAISDPRMVAHLLLNGVAN